jgi:Tfp pilus assembly protein PilX
LKTSSFQEPREAKMLQRLIRDESGIALGLAIIVVVLVGVMGAGLLVFVRSDLNSVITVNQGQKAFDIADAGVQDAKRHLYSQDTTRQHYDLSNTNDCTAGQRLSPEDWSPATTVYVNQDCTGGTTTRSTPGVTKDFAGGKVTVTITCYKQDPAGDCAGVTEGAPEAVAATDKAFFKIISTGEYGGARRKIEAIYYASRSQDVPTGYFADKEDIRFDGDISVKGVSFFSGRNIIVDQANINRTTAAYYGDWRVEDPAYNTERREDAARRMPQTGAGLGAAGLICNSASSCSSNSDSVANGIQDYDSSTGPDGRNVGSKKKFIRKNPATGAQTSNQISYPFDPDEGLPLELLREEAKRQGNYYSSRVDISNANYPTTSTGRTVFFVDADSTTEIDFTVSRAPKAQGVVVINNGNLKTSSSSNGLDGIAVVTGDGSPTGTGNYTSSSNATNTGLVISSGRQTISGNVEPSPGRNFTNVPGFYRVNLWSWRERYD